MINLKEDLLKQVKQGMEGMSGTIPFPYMGLKRFVDIAKNTNYLICADSGSGKSSFSHDLILSTLFYYSTLNDPQLKLSIIYLGMERKQYMYSAKWIARMIFLQEGRTFTIKQILSRERDDNGNIIKLSQEDYELIENYTNMFDEWQKDDVFICQEGTQSPTRIEKFIDEFARRHGTVNKSKDTLSKIEYAPNHPNHIVLFVTDYVGVLDPEKDQEGGPKKQRLDKYSSAMRKARDDYGMSPVNIQQLSRVISSSERLKMNDLKPKLSDIADTSELARDADVVLAVFEPHRYVTEAIDRDILGYDLKKLRDGEGKVFYRTIHILKNSFDSNGLIIPMAFHPVFGIFKTINKQANKMTDDDYNDIKSGNFFLRGVKC